MSIEIVDRQEEKLQGVANVISITSKSHQDHGEIRLEFSAGSSKEQAFREVSDKLREVPQYPENVDEPVVTDTDPESRDYITWIIFHATDPDFDVRKLQDFAEDRIQALLERVPGVSEVNVLGGWEREVQIRFDPVLLAARNITLSDLVTAIRASIAVPVVIEPLVLKGRVYTDGGTVNPLPYDLIKDDCDILVAIDVSGEKVPEEHDPVPSMLENIFSTFQTMQASIIRSKMKNSKPDIIVQPHLPNFQLLDFYRKDEIFKGVEKDVKRFKRELAALIEKGVKSD